MKKNSLRLIAATAFAVLAAVVWVSAGVSQSAKTTQGNAAMPWSQVLAQAKGQTVNWWMWGGSSEINSFVKKLVANAAKQYGITVREVPVSDTVNAIQKVLGEKQAGRNTNGAVDLVWVNGENFATGKQGHLWYCGYTGSLPNSRFVNYKDPSIAYDFGVATDGCEVPWGRAQFAMIYNSKTVPTPPKTIGGLIAWMKANPGQFTYPAPPDFTGSVFVREMLYYVNGGYKSLLGPFNQAKYNKVAPKLWALLNSIKPYLWRQGTTYPSSNTQLDTLYGNGEVAFDMNYGPGAVGGFVAKGQFPASTREFVFSNGMIGNTNYVGIPYNSPHKAAAMVVANILLSPQFQYYMDEPDLFGQYPAIVVSRAGASWVKKIDSIKLPPSVAPAKVLTKNSNPELRAQWVTAIEAGWKKNVLQK